MSRTYRRKKIYKTIESFIFHNNMYWDEGNYYSNIEHSKLITKLFTKFHRDIDSVYILSGVVLQDCKYRRESDKLRGIRSHVKQEMKKILKDMEYDPDFSKINKIKRSASWWY